LVWEITKLKELDILVEVSAFSPKQVDGDGDAAEGMKLNSWGDPDQAHLASETILDWLPIIERYLHNPFRVFHPIHCRSDHCPCFDEARGLFSFGPHHPHRKFSS